MTTFPVRFVRWSRARFPPVYTLLISPYYLLALSWVARAGSEPRSISRWAALFGYPVFWSCFFMLRIIDEHRDAAVDPPARGAQSLITLRELSLLGVGLVALQLGWSIAIDRGIGVVVVGWAIVSFWSWCTGNEFFQSVAWTYRHSVTFAFSHFLVAPMVFCWTCLSVGRAGSSELAVSFEPAFLLVVAFTFLSSVLFDVTRKTWGTEEEREGAYTYSKAWGVRPASTVIALASALAVAVTVWARALLRCDATRKTLLVLDAALVVILVAELVQLRRFAMRPNKIGRKRNARSVIATVIASASALILQLAFEI